MKNSGLRWMNGRAALVGAALPFLGSAVVFADGSPRASESTRSSEVRYILSSVAVTGEVSRSHGPAPAPACVPAMSPVARVSDGILEILMGAGVSLPSGEPAGGSGGIPISGASKCRATLDVAFPVGTFPESVEIGFIAGLNKGVGSLIGASARGALADVPLVEASQQLDWGVSLGSPLIDFSAKRSLKDDRGDSSGLRNLVCAARGKPIPLRLEALVDVEKDSVFNDAALGLNGNDVRVTFAVKRLRPCP